MKKVRKGLYRFMPALFLAAGLVALLVPKAADVKTAEAVDEKQVQTTEEETQTDKTGTSGSVTFAGVGDNLVHEAIYYYWPSRDYTPFYAPMKDIIQNADLAYINFETVCAGDAYGLSGYPSFNGPSEFIDAMEDAGFDWYSTSSNHSMDAGMDGLIHEMDYLKQLDENNIYTGSHRSEEEKYQAQVMEVNGLKVGLAGFTYGLNGYQKPEGADWLIDVFIDEATGTINYPLMEETINRLKENSDVQLVAMHWGDEYSNVPNEIQTEVARWMNQQGVEVIIGTHPHVIQPAEIIHGENQDTLVYYSLGNFLSAQDAPERMVGGLASFKLNYDGETDTTTFEDVKFEPTLMWIQPDLKNYAVYPASQWNGDLAANHWLGPITTEWVNEYVRGVMGDPEGIEIVLQQP